MPLHPAAPEDLAGLVAAYQQTTQAVVDLGHSCSDADFALPTACPGWTVKDQISHVVGLESWLHTGDVPRVDLPDYEHVANEAGEVHRAVRGAAATDGGRQGRRRAGDHRRPAGRAVQRPRRDPRHRGARRLGPAPLGENLPTRILDIWTHEQDIRQALGRPGDLDSGGAAVFMDLLFASLPRLVARNAQIPPGQRRHHRQHRPGRRPGRRVGGGQPTTASRAAYRCSPASPTTATPTTSSPRSRCRPTR